MIVQDAEASSVVVALPPRWRCEVCGRAWHWPSAPPACGFCAAEDARVAEIDHCPKGHALTPSNVYMIPIRRKHIGVSTQRMCRQCSRDAQQRRRAASREKVAALGGIFEPGADLPSRPPVPRAEMMRRHRINTLGLSGSDALYVAPVTTPWSG